jgi:flagellar motor switch protein FliN/FliY
MALKDDEWMDKLTAALASAFSALARHEAVLSVGTAPPAGGWVAAFQGAGSAKGAAFLEFDGKDFEAVAAHILTDPSLVTEEALLDAVKEIGVLTASGFSQDPPFDRAALTLRSVGRTLNDAASGSGVLLRLHVGDGLGLTVRVWGELEGAGVRHGTAGMAVDAKLDALLDIDLPLIVRFGMTDVPLRTAAALGPGSVIDLGRAPDDPVEVLVGNTVVARGEVVVVGGNYGVRVTALASTSERAQTVEVSR